MNSCFNFLLLNKKDKVKIVSKIKSLIFETVSGNIYGYIKPSFIKKKTINH